VAVWHKTWRPVTFDRGSAEAEAAAHTGQP
jgi:hypothetical protein